MTEDRQKTGVIIRRNIRENISHIDQVKNKGFINIAAKRKDNTDRMIKRLNIRSFRPNAACQQPLRRKPAEDRTCQMAACGFGYPDT